MLCTIFWTTARRGEDQESGNHKNPVIRMAQAGAGDGLRTIFSFFLGLVLTAFIGVGVYTFLPPPDQHEQQLEELSRREEALRTSRGSDDLTDSEREQIEEFGRQRTELHEAAAEARKPWGRTTSIILIAFATLTMAVSLVRADQLPVISNGLLLGGVFTMLYGVGWILTTDTSISRFLVMTAALAITLGLGYIRFVRRQSLSPVAAAAAAPGTHDLSHIERRLSDLEQRLNDAANALGNSSTRNAS